MNSIEYIGQLIPLLLFYSFFAFPDKMLLSSISPLGRLISILLITFYTCLHPLYGLAMCAFVILYYQMDCVEGFAALQCNMDSVLTAYNEEAFTTKEDIFRENHCEKEVLKYKAQPVKHENAEHIFPELSFTDETCNPCDKNCGISISNRLDQQEELTYPKVGTEWVSQIWDKWFSSDKTLPYAHTVTKTYYGDY